jgi:DHA2 family multidrug resistance protein
MAHPRTANSAAKPGVSPYVVALVVSMATFMEVLDTSIANVSLRHIAGNLGAGQDESAWVLTSYLVANAIIIPISGWMSSTFGRKRFYMSCVALFTISSLFCGLAPSLGMLLFFRVLQGAGGGGLAPSEQSILADTFPPEQYGIAFAIWGLAVVVAPAIGPTLGGWITDNFSWRWIFFINIPVGLLSMFLTYELVQDPPAHVEKLRQRRLAGGGRVDYMGFIWTVIGFGALQVVLDKGQEDDWFGSPFICAFMAIAVIGIVLLVIWETLIVDDPMVDIPLLTNPNLSSSMVLQFVVGFILTATTVLLPQFVQQLLGYNATNAGLILMPGGVTLMFMMPIAGRLVTRVKPQFLMAFGLLMTSGSMFYLTGFNTQVSFEHTVWVRIIQCVGLPLFFIPLNTIAYGNLPPGKNNNASAMMALMRNLGGSIGISIAFTLLTRRTQLHQERLSAHVTHFYQPFVQMMKASGGFTRDNIIRFYGAIEQQATMLAYLDVFKVMGIGCLLVVGLIAMMRPVKRKPGAAMAH